MASTGQEQQLIQGQAGTLVGYPPILGQATSVAARVGGPTLILPIVGGALPGVVDSVATTTADIVPRGATSIPLAAAITVVRGRQYLVIDSSTGARVVVEAAVGGTVDTLVLQSPMPVEVAAGVDVVGFAVLYTVAALDVGTNLGRGVCQWEAVIDGRTVAWAQDWRVVRRVVAFNLTATDVDQMSSYAAGMKPAGDDDWTESLRASWWRYVAPALTAKGIAPERIVSWEVLNPWHLAALEHHLATTTPEADPQIRAEKAAALVEARTLALESVRFWADMPDDLAPPADVAQLDLTVTFVTR